jgi:hypothetical protein
VWINFTHSLRKTTYIPLKSLFNKIKLII